MSVAEEAKIQLIGRVNAPIEVWGCTKYPGYHTYRFKTYWKCPQDMYPDVVERSKWLIK